MKLSEAIRLGAMLRPQAFDGSVTDGTCALAAAAEALSMRPLPYAIRGCDIVNYSALLRRFPALKDLFVEYPCAPCDYTDPELRGPKGLMSMIFHLNDSHKWTREQIADWLETIEAKHEAATQPHAEVAVCP